ALHFHFANKNMLAEAVETEATEAIRRLTAAAQARQGNALQCVVDATHDLMRSLLQDSIVRGGFELAGDVRRRTNSPLRAVWRQWVEDSLRAAQRSGTLAEGVSPADAARVIVAATAGLEVLGGADATWLGRQNVTRLWELLLPRLADRRRLDSLVCAGSRPPTATCENASEQAL
ncbi:MAG TPA: hypothetical protein VFP69_20555, partial [Streptomyces sp.]|nr:hypothetical protein [Streptomyces sp.]